MKIEVLFPEFCNLFGDSSNMKYLKACLPEAEFVYTSFNDVPLFMTEKPDLIYLGAMTEHGQEMVIGKLMPYKERLRQLIEEDVPMLFTSNAIEVLGKYIENEDGTRIECLGLYQFFAKRDLMHRFNSLVMGTFMDRTIVGFKTQFTLAYGEEKAPAFFEVIRGAGMNKVSKTEGIHDHNLFGTYLVGPFLVLNPYFTLYLMRDVMGIKHARLAFKDEIIKAYKRRVKEFKNPKTSY